VSRWSVDDDDLDRWEPRPNAACSDCGDDFVKAPADVGNLCDPCMSLRDEHTSRVEIRMAKARLENAAHDMRAEVQPVVVDVALVPVSSEGGVVNVALVPTNDARDLKRMAKAILAADLTTIKDVA